MILLYETNFQLREKIQIFFKDKGIKISTFYSLDLLKLTLKKQSASILMVEQNCSDLENLKQLPIRIFEFEKNNWESDVIDVLSLPISNLNKATIGSDKFDVICIGSSTGGFPVIQNIVKNLRFKKTIILICQHISQEHAVNLKEGLEKIVKTKFFMGSDNKELKEGTTYLLPGGADFSLENKYGKLVLKKITSSESFHPSFNELVNSMGKFHNLNMACVILSGLGDDGSKYLKTLPNNIKVIAQDTTEAIAAFMPQAAIATGRVNHIYKIDEMKKFLSRGVQ